MATEPLRDPDPDVTVLRAEIAALEARAHKAEQLSEQLASELAAARAELARRAADDTHLSLFQEPSTTVKPTGPPDGSDPGILPVALLGVAVVALMVALLSAVNTGLASLFTVAMLALAALLGWLAWRTRVITYDVTVSGGVVSVVSAGDTHRFDLRNPSTRLEVSGTPGDSDWQVRFLRRALDPFTITEKMVDPHEFMARLREHRPEL